MKNILFVITILIITGSACGLKNESGTQSTSRPIEPVESNIEITETVNNNSAPIITSQPVLVQPTSAQNINSGPNLELNAYLQNSQDIGNGQKRLFIVFDGKNASYDWYSYYLVDSLGGCRWLFMNNLFLKTEEGNSYTPVVDSSIGCGAKNSILTPPGSTIFWVGDDASNNQGWWGLITFDIPQNATPKEMSMTYGSLDPDWKQAYGSVTTPIHPYSEVTKTDNPFDSNYLESSSIVKLGDSIAFGDLATFTFLAEDVQPDGSFSLKLQITSTDDGYPLSLNPNLNHNFTYFLYQDGTACCRKNTYDWLQDLNFSLGPLQTLLLPTNNAIINVPNPNHYKVWLTGDFFLVETNGGIKTDTERFIVDLSDGTTASVQSGVVSESTATPNPNESSSSLGVNGTWQGEWKNPTGYLYTCEITLEVDQSNNIDGQIIWTLMSSPSPTDQSKIGLSGTEYISGTYDPQTRLVVFEGHEKYDPNFILGLDSYRLSLSDDGNTLRGTTYNHGDWKGELTATRKQ